jgi:L,D-peptidoglycan transpeptidase YkuD (ErfK/YbiS/YcfS/YnhG family)
MKHDAENRMVMGRLESHATEQPTPETVGCVVFRARRAIVSIRLWQTLAVVALLIGCVAMIPASVVGTPFQAGFTPSGPMNVRSPRVVILKAARTLHLFDGQKLVRTYAVDLGRHPIGQKQRKDDGRTPIGSFEVASKNLDSPYHRFIGFNYPDATAAEWGLSHGLISEGQHKSILRALSQGLPPDGSTALGGGIGIHGRREGRDWTGGCAALSNEHVEELYSVLRIGDPIEILP